MNDPTRGGRGKVAPYETTHVRTPLPVKDIVEQIVNTYKQSVGNSETSKVDNYLNLLKDAICRLTYVSLFSNDPKDYDNFLKTIDPEYKKEQYKNMRDREKIENAIDAVLKKKKSARISMELLIKELYPLENDEIE